MDPCLVCQGHVHRLIRGPARCPPFAHCHTGRGRALGTLEAGLAKCDNEPT
jgi:hypothetical protein